MESTDAIALIHTLADTTLRRWPKQPYPVDHRSAGEQLSPATLDMCRRTLYDAWESCTTVGSLILSGAANLILVVRRKEKTLLVKTGCSVALSFCAHLRFLRRATPRRLMAALLSLPATLTTCGSAILLHSSILTYLWRPSDPSLLRPC